MEVLIYKTKNGKEPFAEWLENLDKRVKFKVIARLNSMREGCFGHCRFLGNGVSELKFRDGIRVYYSEVQKVVIILLCGGGKNTKKDQSKDIARAKVYLEDYLERKKNETDI